MYHFLYVWSSIWHVLIPVLALPNHPDGDTKRLVTSGWNGIRRGVPQNQQTQNLRPNHVKSRWSSLDWIYPPPSRGGPDGIFITGLRRRVATLRTDLRVALTYFQV